MGFVLSRCAAICLQFIQQCVADALPAVSYKLT